MNDLFILLGLFFCHFLADYTHLSTNWMLKAKRFGTPLFPIFVHALIHALLMSLFLEIFLNYNKENYNPFEFSFSIIDKVFLFQLITHFLIDVLKGKMNVWFPLVQSPANKWHWIVFGIDQYLHQIVIVIIYLIVR